MMKLALSTLTILYALLPGATLAEDCFTFSASENVCFTGVFPTDPIIIEYGQPIAFPDTHYVNSTDRSMTFTIEWAGAGDVSGSGTIHSLTLPPRTDGDDNGLSLSLDPAPEIGIHQITIGWSAFGSKSGDTDYVATVQRTLQLVVVLPGQLREVIQIPVRWCVVEGSPQAQGHTAGQTVFAPKLLSVVQQVNEKVWLPGASILFRPASAPNGFPVVADPDTRFNEPGDVGLTGGFGGNSGEWATAGHFCEQAWSMMDPDQRGIALVNARTLIPETLTVIGGVTPAIPRELRVGNALCSHPRTITVDDVTQLAFTVVYDPALYKHQPGNYLTPTFDPVKVLAHEIGHTLTLGHGNGLDDNGDGLLPPTPGIRRYDEYCDPLVDADGNVLEDGSASFVSCDASSSLLRADECLNLRPLQREMARAAAKLVPGAIVTDPSADPAGRVVALPGTCQPNCTIAPGLVLKSLEVAETPGLAVTSFTHSTVGAFPANTSSRYVVYADLDNDTHTGCGIAEPGLPTFQGAELRTQVTVTVAGTTTTVVPQVWQCSAGSWVQSTDPAIAASAFVQTADVHGAPPETNGGGVVTIRMPDSVRGPAGNVVRVQAASQSGTQSDRLPASGAGAVVLLIPPQLPTCTTSPPVAHPGQTITIAASGVPASQAAQLFVGSETAGTATSNAAGQLQATTAVPSTSAQGTRSVEARFSGGVTAACAIVVNGGAVTPITTATESPTPNASGWNKTSVNVSLTATDAPGGPGIQEITYSATGAQAIATTTRSGASAQLTFSQEGQTVLHYFATNNGNVSEPPHDLPLNIDVTAPVVQYTGNQGVYGLLDTVHITCTASDALSGLLTNTCKDITGPAYLFAAKGNTFSATATDLAENVTTVSTTFQLNVTYPDLCTLTRTFIGTSNLAPRPATLLGRSLCSQLSSAQAAQTRGDLSAKNRVITAYVHQVAANTPVVFTPEQARILTALATAL